MVDESTERRAFGRIDIDTYVEYRLEGQANNHPCVLDNISANGVLLYTEQCISLGSKVLITIHSDNADDPPIGVTAVVIRASQSPGEATFGYGCQIEAVIDT